MGWRCRLSSWHFVQFFGIVWCLKLFLICHCWMQVLFTRLCLNLRTFWFISATCWQDARILQPEEERSREELEMDVWELRSEVWRWECSILFGGCSSSWGLRFSCHDIIVIVVTFGFYFCFFLNTNAPFFQVWLFCHVGYSHVYDEYIAGRVSD